MKNTILMSEDEVKMTLESIFITDAHQKHQDRVVTRIINYIEANMDDFLECYSEETDEDGVIHMRDKYDPMSSKL